MHFLLLSLKLKFKYSVPVIDKLDYVFSENGLVAKGKGVEIERNVSTKLYNYPTPQINTELFVTIF